MINTRLLLPLLFVLFLPRIPAVILHSTGWPCCHPDDYVWGDYNGRLRPNVCMDLNPFQEDEFEIGLDNSCCVVCWCTMDMTLEDCAAYIEKLKQSYEEPLLPVQDEELNEYREMNGTNNSSNSTGSLLVDDNVTSVAKSMESI